MIDLNSTLFFKGQFDIHLKGENNDPLWVLILKIRKWMVSKWQKNGEEIPDATAGWSTWKRGGYISSVNNIVKFKSVYHKNKDELEFWACKIIESWPSKNGYAPREWTTEIGFQQTAKKSASINIVIYYSDRPGFIGPCEDPPKASIPGIIHSFINDKLIECTIERYPFTLKPIHLKPGDFPDFWEKVCDENRKIPIIYISPRRGTEIVENLISPQKLMDILGPNALIYYANDINFSREMTELCEPINWGCYSGSIRIYAPCPQICDDNDSYRHRYISARTIAEIGDSVYDILRRALAQDVHFYDNMFRMEDCQALNEHAAFEKKMEEYKYNLESQVLDLAGEQETQFNKEKIQWDLDKGKYLEKIRELKDELYNAQNVGEAYREAAILSNTRADALNKVRNIEQYPKTATEIAEYFKIHFADRIAFTKRGEASLKECITDPSILWDAFYQIATRLFDLYTNDEVSDVDKQFNQQSNFRMVRGEGRMTRRNSNLMKHYHDKYDGKTINIETHIKTKETKEQSPKFLRIYFCYDSEVNKIIIGSCGKHLENQTTAKIK